MLLDVTELQHEILQLKLQMHKLLQNHNNNNCHVTQYVTEVVRGKISKSKHLAI